MFAVLRPKLHITFFLAIMAAGHLATDQPHNNLSIFLLGKRGSGKSRTGNSILGKPFDFKFGIQTDDFSVKEIENRFGKNMYVIDTPADQLKLDKIEEKINEYKEKSIPIYIFCIQIGRFNQSDYSAYDMYKKCLGESIFTHSLVVFTCYDKWENDMKDLNIENPEFNTYILSLSHQNRTLMHLCGHRWVAFNNRLTGDENDDQVKKLLGKIDDILKLRKVSESKFSKLKKICFGPGKIENAGAVPSIRKPKSEKK